MKPVPDFIIIGAQKAGTSSVFRYLEQHPQVFASRLKEPRFFSHLAKVEAGVAREHEEAVKTLESYRGLFSGSDGLLTGEASVAYLEIPGTASVIKRHAPRVKLIVLLRNPADRSYSQYLMQSREGRNRDSFEETVAKGGCLRGGFYHRNLLPFYRLFDKSQIGVFLYDDLVRDPSALIRGIYRYLDIDPEFVPDLRARHNQGGQPRNRLSAKLVSLRGLNQLLKRFAPQWLVLAGMEVKRLSYTTKPMPETARRRLIDIYRDDTTALEGLIGRDLSGWRTPRVADKG
jgi:Sulfotransferase domain